MKVIDITRPFEIEPLYWIKESHVDLKSDATEYTGVVYDLNTHSMVGSYIDFPGHIKETSNGEDAFTVRLEDFYRLPADIIHLNRESDSGAISGAELANAFGNKKPMAPLLALNALGKKNPWEIELRSVWLDDTAVQWIIDSGCRIFMSDVYESKRLEGVFQRLFKANISTVCEPTNLSLLGDRALISIMFLPIPKVTQVPCRIVAECE
ncbi:MAG: cyclase family protein [Victivallales bacterium]|nr:cyclase family protein [Victivallales bacterium]